MSTKKELEQEIKALKSAIESQKPAITIANSTFESGSDREIDAVIAVAEAVKEGMSALRESGCSSALVINQ
jgi:hypothetical protein